MKIDNILKSVLCSITATMVLASTASAQSKSLDLAFLTNNASDFWTIARAGCDQAQKEVPNIKVEFKIPADGTAAEQTRIFDDLLVKSVNGIALSPVDPPTPTALIAKSAAKALLLTH